MSDVKVTLANGDVEVFEDTIGHQVGYGAAQVMMEDGSQVVFNNFNKLETLLTDEEKADFIEVQKKARERAEAAMQLQEEEEKKRLELVPANDPVAEEVAH